MKFSYDSRSIMNNQEESSEEEINLLDYWRVIWKRKILIISVVFLITLLSAIISLYKTEIYQAKAIISPISEEKGGGGLSLLSQQFGGIAGISLPASTSSKEIMNLLNSNMIREKMITKYNLLPVLFSKKWDKEKKEWIDKTPTMWNGIRTLNSIIKVTNNIKENTISVSADFHDPEITVVLVDDLLSTLSEHMGNESKRSAIIKRRYLEEQLRSTSDPLIRQKIYNLISQQVETAMMSEMNEYFAYKVIDPPRVPDRRIRPNRRNTVVLSFIVSSFIGIFLAFFFEYIKKLREREA